MKLRLGAGRAAALVAFRCVALGAASRLKAAGGAASASLADFDHLRQSIIRIQAVAQTFDWLAPFQPGQDQVGLGSGFAVQADPYPLFVTNQHVVNDAKQVTVQLLLYGEHQWEAEVVSVCPHFDLALLVLKSPGEFHEAMDSRNISLSPLRLSDRVAAMGEDVVALGFPLGQDALKISKGNIAGNEEVDGNICIQSTAPISPGNSGGPLLDGAAREVVGVNFAKATEGENINYVIPAWRVSQLVRKHLKDQAPQRGGPGHLTPKVPTFQRLPVKVPRVDLVTIESNEALYEGSGGCGSGIYVAKVGRRSFFTKAEPPVPSGSFLTAVNGVELDQFGMGLNADYAADRVSFNDLFFMIHDLSANIEVETCYQGKTARHSVSTAYLPEYDRGLRWVDEPYIEESAKKFEMFGDLSVMELTVNHVHTILQTSGDPLVGRWLHPDFVTEPRLLINYVRSGSYTANVIPAGTVVARVNGHEVGTLEEFRQHFSPKPGSNIWTLENDMGQVAALAFNTSLTQQVSMAISLDAPYLLTPGVVGAARRMGLIKEDGAVAAPNASGHRGHRRRSGAAALLQARAAGPLEARPAAALSGASRGSRTTRWASAAPLARAGARAPQWW